MDGESNHDFDELASLDLLDSADFFSSGPLALHADFKHDVVQRGLCEVAALAELEGICEQLLDDRVTDIWVRTRLALQPDVNLFEHHQVVLDFIFDPPKLLLFGHDPRNQHLVPVVSENLTEHLR